jgi:hypothetical protein
MIFVAAEHGDCPPSNRDRDRVLQLKVGVGPGFVEALSGVRSLLLLALRIEGFRQSGEAPAVVAMTIEILSIDLLRFGGAAGRPESSA